MFFLLLIIQEFDNADGEECSGGSSPIQEDSLSSCPSLPEVYTLPVRDRPNSSALQDGAGNNLRAALLFRYRTSLRLAAEPECFPPGRRPQGLLPESLMWIQQRTQTECSTTYWISPEWKL